MSAGERPAIPVWTLTSEDVDLPMVASIEAMTADRLSDFRAGLAAMAHVPITTLEAHPMPKDVDLSTGLHLDKTSPLAMHLGSLISKSASPSAAAGAGSEILYRMVAPAKLAADLGAGMVRPMTAQGGGIHGTLAEVGSSRIVGQAAFIPVKAAVGVGAMAIAAPLIMMSVAAALSIHAERKRERAMAHLTTLLEQLHDDALKRERSALNGCRDAIEKATAILLDEGKLGAALGLSPAVHAINTALADADERLKTWQRALTHIGDERVEVKTVAKTFPGIDGEGGTFRAHLELAELAISLKRRVIMVQAVEQAQSDPGNPLENFMRTLQVDQARLAKLEGDIECVLRRLSRLKLDRSHGVRDFAFSSGQVDDLLRASYRLREIADGIEAQDPRADVAIEMARQADGSVIVFPAYRVLSA